MDKSKFEFLEMLDDQETLMKVPADTVLFSEGEVGDKMYIVLEGEVRLSINDQALGMETEGGIIGEMALIEEAPRSATATTSTDCVLAPLDVDAFKSLVQKNPGFAIHLMQVLSQRPVEIVLHVAQCDGRARRDPLPARCGVRRADGPGDQGHLAGRGRGVA